MKGILFTVLAVILSLSLNRLLGQSAETPVASTNAVTLLQIYNVFLDAYSRETASWKTDITLNADVNTKPNPPYHLHYDDFLGYYTYRSKTWGELNNYEKFAVMNDPRMAHFIREKAAQKHLTRNDDPKAVAQAQPATTQATPASSQTSVVAQAPAAQSGAITPPPQPDVSKELEDILKNTRSLLREASSLETALQGQRGMLAKEASNPDNLAYQFEAEELLSSNPIRLMEVQ